jgi:methyl-accepting chemotaxis protein
VNPRRRVPRTVGPTAAHGEEPFTDRAADGQGLGITAKLGMLAGGLVVIIVVSVGLALWQAGQTTTEYDQLLAHQVDDALSARRVQVEFKRQVQEWKDILLRGSNSADLATYSANFRAEDALVGSLTDALIAQTADPQVRRDLTTVRAEHQQLDAGYARALAGFVAGHGKDFAAADRLVRGQDRPPTTLLDGVVTYLGQQVTAKVNQQKAAVATRQRVGLVGTLALTCALAMLVTVVVRRIVQPVRGLTVAARKIADRTLPDVITRIKALPADAEPPALPRYRVDTRDELKDLAEAFTQVQDSAVRMATEQHRAERQVAEMLINLGRRNQNLLGRLLSLVTDLERGEQDADVLAQLFRLDHAATRIRRNAESMLVLAGATQTRTFAAPVQVEDVVRAALSEIEDYVRVDLYHVEEGQVSGSAAADLVHLLAELIENATHFSPPSSQVTVIGQRTRAGYRIRVIDQGVGMTQRELLEANDRIARSAEGWADAKLLGLHVVGRLAARRGIDVALEPSAARGITATVLIPTHDLVDDRGPAPAPEALPAAGRTPGRPAPALPRNPSGTRPGLPPAQPVPAPTPEPFRGRSPDPATAPQTMPKRVRGAQLAGLHLDETDTAPAFAPAPARSGWNLRNFQLEVEAARQAIATGDPGVVDLRDGARSASDHTQHGQDGR